MRGVHSTGIAGCSSFGVDVVKYAIDPVPFLDMGQVKAAISTHQICLMGHNRQATKGAVNHVNAHPFTHGDITLMHNGTLTNKIALEAQFSAPTFDTDSELVCWLIDNYELATVVEALEGAFALTWWDSKTESLHIINNGEREFHVAMIDGAFYWASEKLMLAWILDRCSLSYPDTVIYSPKVGRHVTVKYDEKRRAVGVEYEDLELAPKKPTARITTSMTQGTGITTTKREQDAMEAFEAEYKLSLKVGSDVYVYPTTRDKPYAGSPARILLTGTLSTHPYCDVKVHYLQDNPVYFADSVYALRMEVQSIREQEDGFLITCSNNPEKIAPVHLTDEVGVERVDKWGVRSAPDEDSTFSGYGGSQISWEKFETVLNHGCACCSDPLDPVQEAVDRSVTFISHDECVCLDCANSPLIKDYYGIR